MTLMEEDARRRAALEIQAEMMAKVTRKQEGERAGVTDADGASPSGSEGRAGRAERPPAGPKIAKKSAVARAPEARPRAREEAERTKPDRRENEFMMNLMILRNSLAVCSPACRERARRAGKWVWRDIRLMLTLVCRIQEQLLKTMPDSREEYYRAYAQYGHYELHMNGPVRTARHILMTDRHAAALAEAAMKSECILCMREGNEIGRCELREALLESAVPTELQEGRFRKCEYRDAAGALVQGRDVSI